ncbi:MerR family DNA-binding transcriptional regulator, partial [Hoeflea sp.]
MPNPSRQGLLTIGEVASRTGLAVSAIRYYDDQ